MTFFFRLYHLLKSREKVLWFSFCRRLSGFKPNLLQEPAGASVWKMLLEMYALREFFSESAFLFDSSSTRPLLLLLLLFVFTFRSILNLRSNSVV